MNRSIWIGWDRREGLACEVARHSLMEHMSQYIQVHSLVLADVVARGLYKRPTSQKHGRLIDELSIRSDYDGSIATEHANARFLVKDLARSGWALFCDGDFLFRDDICKLFDGLDPKYAVYCVKHDYHPGEAVKMDGQVQTTYSRKNWSSLMIFNCDHPANRFLTLGIVNSWPGRDLHAFNWLADDDIGEIDPAWNYLVGVSSKVDNPKGVHFTLGTPDMPGYRDCEYADEWVRVVAKITPVLAEA